MCAGLELLLMGVLGSKASYRAPESDPWIEVATSSLRELEKLIAEVCVHDGAYASDPLCLERFKSQLRLWNEVLRSVLCMALIAKEAGNSIEYRRQQGMFETLMNQCAAFVLIFHPR